MTAQIVPLKRGDAPQQLMMTPVILHSRPAKGCGGAFWWGSLAGGLMATALTLVAGYVWVKRRWDATRD